MRSRKLNGNHELLSSLLSAEVTNCANLSHQSQAGYFWLAVLFFDRVALG